MAEYIPSTSDWVREQVELYERTNGAEGNTLRDVAYLLLIENIDPTGRGDEPQVEITVNKIGLRSSCSHSTRLEMIVKSELIFCSICKIHSD